MDNDTKALLIFGAIVALAGACAVLVAVRV